MTNDRESLKRLRERKVKDEEKGEWRDRSGGSKEEEDVVRTAFQHAASTETNSRTATWRRRRKEQGDKVKIRGWKRR